MAPYGDRFRGSWAAARRRVRLAAVRVASAVRAALMRVMRRLAEAGTAGSAGSPPTKICSTQVLQDEYRAGFCLPSPRPARAASDLHECPWCLSLGNPDTPGRDDPAEH